MVDFLRKIIPSANDRAIKRFKKTVQKINAFEPSIKSLSDEELKQKTPYLRNLISKGEKLDNLLAEAFAVVREAAKRILGERPFDVQLVGGVALHKGMIAEMKTGEGKTLVATLPVYLNALSEKGVHVVTVNDYLAKRDAEWMGKIYEFLGLKVGCITNNLDDDERRKAYSADVTYGTNHEFGFDYLRDNMKFHLQSIVMRPFNYAIVDEVDSILIDEARTPLIISGASEDSSELYEAISPLIIKLITSDYEKDEKQRSVMLTETGVENLEKQLFEKNLIKGTGLYDIHNIQVVHHINAALLAHILYRCDVDYIIKNGEVILIDEFTGRMMDGRRLSDGIHQAIEAKEKVKIQTENQTLATITYQNFFRLYPKLSGMSGSSVTEAAEFEEIYNLPTIEVPSNVPVIRKDHDDEVYLTESEKYEKVIEQIKICHGRKQPVLVGTVSIEKSEFLSELLKKGKIPHQVLNARYHEQEAFIIAEAGRSGAVTIATNMAGRGTDIKFGGSLDMRVQQEIGDVSEDPNRDKRIEEIKKDIVEDKERVKQAGGLFVIGTERHESRRIDNQLRGRSGRQGDPGASKFFISLEDDLMRIFGSNRLSNMFRKIGVKEGDVITHSWISKAIERAQRKVEAHNFDIRKHLLRYDDVMNDQRKVIYEQRLELMEEDNIRGMTKEICFDITSSLIQNYLPDNTVPELWDSRGLNKECKHIFSIEFPFEQWIEENILSKDILSRIIENFTQHIDAKEKRYGNDVMRLTEKALLLRVLDQGWKDHLLQLDHLRQGINLRAYAQANPLNEYKREAFNLFKNMMGKIKEEFIILFSRFEWNDEKEESQSTTIFDDIVDERSKTVLTSSSPESSGQYSQFKKSESTPSRNALCPCGSGKKYKRCHGAIKK
ncbi:MAG: preprotein translocase subunit SecA [Alphaproteobacteria bacterium]